MCKKTRKNMSSYIDGLLSLNEKSSFEEHISKCENCKKELAELKIILNLTSNSAVQVPDTFAKNVMEKVEKEALHKKRFSIYQFPKFATVFLSVFLLAVILKTPVMDYFEKSYTENESALKPSTSYMSKTDQSEEVENNSRTENPEDNIHTTGSIAFNENSENINKQNSAVEKIEQKPFDTEDEIQTEGALTTPSADIISPEFFDTSYDKTDDTDKTADSQTASSGGGGNKVTASMPDEKLIIYTDMPINDAKSIIESTVGYEVLVLNGEISLKLSKAEYQKLYNALYDDTSFDGFDKKVLQDTINVVFVSNFSN